MVVVRGISGSGKTTFAEYLASQNGVICSADDFLINDKGEYDWHWSKLKGAHQACYDKAKGVMEWGLPVIIANTSVRERDVNEYMDLAKEFDYRVFSVIVENRHGGVNSHDVPEESLEKQRNKFSIKL